MKPAALALISLIFAASVASCGNVTPIGTDGGTTGSAGKPATGSAGSTGAAGTGAAGTGAAGTGSGTGTAGTGSGTGAAGTGTGSGSAGTGMMTGAAGTGMTTGAAGTGMTTGAAGMGAAGMGAAGTGGRPCIDKLCQGACTGDSCGGTWTCDPMVACIEIAAQYCGCDGKTFTASGCSPRAFAHRGACEAGVSCDPTKILCKRLAPACPAGQVPSVEGTCYGPCVKVEECNCTAPAACPDPNQYTCHMNTKRCGPYVN